MMKTKMTMSKSVRRLLLAVPLVTFALPVTLSLATPASAAQSTHHIERTVDGKVVNKTDAPLGGSVVYLKDTHSLTIKTYICDEAGHFHFGQLSQNSDYDLWAESNGVKSNTKSISSFDDRNSYYFTLTVK
jgi:hypothetical protein